ncbi:MAG TPA: glycosyltransferase family 4 protein [Ktedonobacteraceae bacterium]|nr:glycosyltransferase family 4 protein [Ktedonobacteraceae bacterium]
MRIAQIAPPWITIPPKNYGGTEMVIYNLVEALVAQGHDVTLFAPGDARTSARQIAFYPTALLEEGVPWRAHLKAHYHLYCATEQVAQNHFDIVHMHLSSSTDMYVFPLTTSLATPHVATLHSNFPFDAAPGWAGDADQYYIRKFPMLPVVAISESARRNQTLPLNIVDVVYNGIMMSQFTLSKKPRGGYFAWLGRFSPEKGAHLAIEAAKRARVPLVLAGTIDRSSKERTQYFYEVIKPQADNEQIRYIGPVNMKEKVSLLNHARGLLNPIEWEEPFGMVMIEAMAVDCPVISFARGAALELVVDGETGFLVQNLDQMVERIADIDQVERAALRPYVERNFSAEAMARNYVRVYQNIIAANTTSGANGTALPAKRLSRSQPA